MATDGPNRIAASNRRKAVNPSCESCFFGCRMLCALDLDAPCTTYRPDSSEGLVPPSQTSLLMEAEADPTVGPTPIPVPLRAPVFIEHPPVQMDLRELVPA